MNQKTNPRIKSGVGAESNFLQNAVAHFAENLKGRVL